MRKPTPLAVSVTVIPDDAPASAEYLALIRRLLMPPNDAGRSTPQKVSGQQDLDTTMAAASARPLKEAPSCDVDER